MKTTLELSDGSDKNKLQKEDGENTNEVSA